MEKKEKRVLVVDDSATMRQLVRMMVMGVPGGKVDGSNRISSPATAPSRHCRRVFKPLSLVLLTVQVSAGRSGRLVSSVGGWSSGQGRRRVFSGRQRCGPWSRSPEMMLLAIAA